MMDKAFETEVIERLTKIETKLDDYQNYKSKSEEANNRSKDNERRIAELEDNSKWLKRAVFGAMISSTIALLFIVIQIGLGLK